MLSPQLDDPESVRRALRQAQEYLKKQDPEAQWAEVEPELLMLALVGAPPMLIGRLLRPLSEREARRSAEESLSACSTSGSSDFLAISTSGDRCTQFYFFPNPR